jgi:transposase
LASNDKTLDGELMLQYYKGQNAVEKGFHASSVSRSFMS